MNLTAQFKQFETELAELNRLAVLFRTNPEQRRLYDLLRMARAVSGTVQAMECKVRQKAIEPK